MPWCSCGQADVLALEPAVDRAGGGDRDRRRRLLRLDQRAPAAPRQPGGGELPRMLRRPEPDLDPDPALVQQRRTSSSQPSSMTLSDTQSGSSVQPRTHSSRRSTSPSVIQSPVESEISSSGAASRSARHRGAAVLRLEALEAVGAARVHVHRDGAGLGDLRGVARELVRRQRQPLVVARAAATPLRQAWRNTSAAARRRTRRSTCPPATRPAPCRRCRRRRRAAAARAARPSAGRAGAGRPGRPGDAARRFARRDRRLRGHQDRVGRLDRVARDVP